MWLKSYEYNTDVDFLLATENMHIDYKTKQLEDLIKRANDK